MIFNKYPWTDFHEMNLDWLIKTVKALIDAVESLDDWKNQFEEQYEQIVQLYNDLVSGNFPPAMYDALTTWVQNNAVTLVGEMVKMVTFTCNDAGYLVAHVPDSWTGIIFKTTGLDFFPAGYDYGHLAISY